MKIFLSYCHSEKQLADEIAARLRSERHVVFFDRDTLPKGEAFDLRIRTEIAASDVFLFLISPDSVKLGSYSMTELKFARAFWPTPGNHVFPIMAVDTPRIEIPGYLSAINYFKAEGNLAAELCFEMARIESTLQNERDSRPTAAFPVAATIIGTAVAISISTFAIKALTDKYHVIKQGPVIDRMEQIVTKLETANRELGESIALRAQIVKENSELLKKITPKEKPEGHP